MRKKILIGTIFPLTAMLAVIGSGFSLWVFNDSNHVEVDTKVGIKTTDVLTSGNILVYNDCYWPSYKEGKNDTSYQNYSYIEFDQVLDESQDYNLLKHPSDDKHTSAYYLWSNKDSITNTINNSTGYTRNYNIETKTGIPFENLGEEGGTDIIFTTTIVIPIEMAPYLTLSYKTSNTHDTLQARGFNKIIGSQYNVSTKDYSMTYTIIERYSDLDPNGSYKDEIYSSLVDGYINHEYKDKDNKKYGFKFFDWGNMSIKYFNSNEFDKEDHSGLSDEEIAKIKAWHKTQPNTLTEFNTMISNITNYDGKAASEQFNYKIALGVTYKAEVCTFDAERANTSNSN